MASGSSRAAAAAACLCWLLLAAPAAAAPGDLDPTFGAPNGFVLRSLEGAGGITGDRAIIEPATGRILVNANAFDSGGSWMGAMRFLPDGSPDPSFKSGTQPGAAFVQFVGESSVQTAAMLLQPNGDVVVGGSVGGPADFAVARFTSSGSLDTTHFNALGPKPGTNVTDQGTDDARIGGLGLQSGGSIIAVGNKGDDLDVIPYDSNGIAGTPKTDPFTGVTGVRVGAVVVLASDRVVVGGTATVAGVQRFMVARLMPDGSPDTTFGSDGILTFNLGSPTVGDQGSDIAVEPDGSIVIAGGVDADFPNGDFGLAKVTPTGSLDSSFGSGGTTVLSVSPNTDIGRAVALQSDGKILVGGRVGATGEGSGDSAVARFGTLGAPDPGFGTGGFMRYSPSPIGDGVNGLAVQPDGKIVASGFAFIVSPAQVTVARLLGGEPPAPGAATGSADRTKPKIGIKLLSRHLRRIRHAKALRVRVTLSEAGTVSVTLGLITKKRAKKSRRVALAKARVRFAGAGAKTIKLKLGRKARLRLARVTKARIRLSVSATDLAGNRATRTLTRTLRR